MGGLVSRGRMELRGWFVYSHLAGTWNLLVAEGAS